MQTDVQTNLSRQEIVGSALSHSSNPMLLEEGEDFTVTYALSAEQPTMTISGTFKIVKTYDAPSDTLSLQPYFAQVG